VLDAASALQSALDREDLGCLHHEAVRDGNSTTLVAVLRLPRARVSGLSWATASDALVRASSVCQANCLLLTDCRSPQLAILVLRLSPRGCWRRSLPSFSSIAACGGALILVLVSLQFTLTYTGLYLVLITAESTMSDIFVKLLRTTAFLPLVRYTPVVIFPPPSSLYPTLSFRFVHGGLTKN
jgi:hypothetical protein